DQSSVKELADTVILPVAAAVALAPELPVRPRGPLPPPEPTHTMRNVGLAAGAVALVFVALVVAQKLGQTQKPQAATQAPVASAPAPAPPDPTPAAPAEVAKEIPKVDEKTARP